MSTDQDNMVQELKDPTVNFVPDYVTTKETAKSPLVDNIEGDPSIAYAQLKKVTQYLEQQKPVNDQMILTARRIRDHYVKTKTISKDQYAWIVSVSLPAEFGSIPGPHGTPPPEPVDDPEGDALLAAELAEKRRLAQLERDKEAPPLPNIIVGSKIGD